MKKMKAEMLYDDDGATPDDLREAVEIFEEVYRTSRRLLGAAHPRVFDIELNLKSARAALRPRGSVNQKLLAPQNNTTLRNRGPVHRHRARIRSPHAHRRAEPLEPRPELRDAGARRAARRDDVALRIIFNEARAPRDGPRPLE